MNTIKKRIEIVPYDPLWPEMFDAEAASIRNALGKNCLAIHHVGSTSVPNLSAKPKIDILAVIKEGVNPIKELESIGYEYRGEFNIPFQFGFSKRIGNRVNLHVFEEGNPEIQLNLLFRDYLRKHQEAREQYQQLKETLVSKEASHEKNHPILSGYNLGKNEFIQDILSKAGFDGICLRFCCHHLEWEAAKRLRQKYFFDKVPISDPYTWTFDHKEHVHFVLYKGNQIIGYAHIQLWSEERCAIRIIVMDEDYRNLRLGTEFLLLCEKWLKKQGIKILQAEVAPLAKRFYLRLAYQPMPFDDPSGEETHPNDTPLGKYL